MIRVTCEGCGAKYQVPDAVGGKVTKCTKCQHVIHIPLAAAAAADPMAQLQQAAAPAARAPAQESQAASAPVAVAPPPEPPVPVARLASSEAIAQAAPAGMSKGLKLGILLGSIGLVVLAVLIGLGYYVVVVLPENSKIEMLQARVASAKSDAKGLLDESTPLEQQDPAALAGAREKLLKVQGLHDELLKDILNLGFRSQRGKQVQKDLQESRDKIVRDIERVEACLWPGPGTMQEMFRRVAPSIPQIRVPDANSSGSGFLLEHNGTWWVATNRHVISRAKTGAIIVFRVGPEDRLRDVEIKVPRSGVQFIHRSSDLAVIALTDSDIDKLRKEGIRPLPLRPPDHPTVKGESCWVVGHPGVGGKIGVSTFGAGSVARIESNMPEFAECIQIDAPINHGNSGGPVFNSLGRVIGQATFFMAPGGPDMPDRQNFAVNVEMLRGLLTGEFNVSKEEIGRILAPEEVLPEDYKRVAQDLAQKGFKPCNLASGHESEYLEIGYRPVKLKFQAEAGKTYTVALISSESSQVRLYVGAEGNEQIPPILKDRTVDIEQEVTANSQGDWNVYAGNVLGNHQTPVIIALFEKT